MTTVRPTITAEAFLSSRELNKKLPKKYLQADAFFDLLHEEQGCLREQRVPESSELRQVTTDAPLLFRGQSDQQHGLSASLHRFIRAETSKSIAEGVLADLEAQLLHDMRDSRGLGRGLTDGQLLMLLQHHGAPTRMLDVSDRPLEALYFAVEEKDATDGRLFLLSLPGNAELPMSSTDGLPWANKSVGSSRSTSDWTRTVKLIEDTPLDARMSAQRGRFLVGGVNRSYGELSLSLGSQILSAAELQDVTMLMIGFLKGKANPTTKWPALGWSIRIPASWKKRLRDRLDAEAKINHDTIYPDLSHVSWTGFESARRELAIMRKPDLQATVA